MQALKVLNETHVCFLILVLSYVQDDKTSPHQPLMECNEFGFAVNAGSGHNLDLSLGISQPSSGQKGTGNLGDFQFRYKERPMVCFCFLILVIFVCVFVFVGLYACHFHCV